MKECCGEEGSRLPGRLIKLQKLIGSSPQAPRVAAEMTPSGKGRRLSLLGCLPEESWSNLTVVTKRVGDQERGLGVLTEGPNVIHLDSIDPSSSPLRVVTSRDQLSMEGSEDDGDGEDDSQCGGEDEKENNILCSTNIGRLDHPQYTGSRFDADKPPYSYATLIAEAILKAPEHRLTLNLIYHSIMTTYPYYQSRNSGWQNSIRHNLSLNRCFQRLERVEGERGKGSWWTVREEYLEMEGGRWVPKAGSMLRKKKAAVAGAVEAGVEGRLEAPLPVVMAVKPAMGVNRLQYDFAMDTLLCLELYEDHEAHANLVDLCASLQKIHSESCMDHIF